MELLEYEKKINEIECKINDFKKISVELNVDLSVEINKLENKVKELHKTAYSALSSFERLSIAKHTNRPTSLDYIERIFDDFIELHGDRYYKDDPSIVGGICVLNNIPVTIIGQQKGRNTKENIKRNFGMPSPEGYRKALRLMKQAEKFKRPVICFVDTPGAYCGIEAEERGQGEAIARNLMEMSSLKVPIISIFIGEGGSGGALALGVADKVLMLENAVYSILSPEGFASIMWKDSSRAKEAAEIMKITAKDLFDLKIVDKIIKEPLGGAHNDITYMANTIKNSIVEEIEKIIQIDSDNLIADRYNRFRKFGDFTE